MHNPHIRFAVTQIFGMVAGIGLSFWGGQVAAEDATKALTQPTSKIEAGVGGVSDSNWKFGQYNGLNSSGAFGIGSFDIQGGGTYDSNDATRWRVTGNNIGLETRDFKGEYKDQGKYKVNFGYDEITAYRNNSYQTPYNGAGGSNLTLPSNWLYPTTANNLRTLPASDRAEFENFNLGTKRRRIDGGFSFQLSPEWEALVSVRHEDKNGTQALGAPIVAPRAVILPNPIVQATEQINASLKFSGSQAYAQLAYYGSIFHNDVNAVTFQNPFAAGLPTFGRMSTMPDNQFHQFNLTGAYNFSSATKLVVNGAYARNWQDQTFLPYNTLVGGGGSLPTSNLNGVVETKSANLKLTHRVNKDLNLSSSYKYDERENTTPINQYSFVDVDGTGNTASVRNNTPFSKRINQGNLEADYALAKGHWLKAGYELQNIDRWCNGSWLSCVDAGTTTEHTGKLDYRGTLFDKLSSKIGYAYSNRTADNYNQDNAAFASFPASNQLLFDKINATGLTAWGPALPYAAGSAALYPNVFPNNNPATTGGPLNNAIDIAGLGRFNTSARERQKVHSYFDYALTEKLTLGLGGDYRFDNYPDSQFGLKSSTNWGVNLDAGYAFNEDTSMQLYYSYQDILSKTAGMSYAANSNTGSAKAGSVIGGCVNSVLAVNNTARVDPCRNWFTNMNDNIDTVGLGIKRKGLLSGKLELNGDFLYSFARTLIGVAGGQYVQSPKGTTADGPYFYIPAADLPTVKTQTFQFKLDAKYQINKPSALHLTYLYQHLFSSDYVYTGTQFYGTPAGVMPTNEQAPNYSIHAVGLSYILNF